METTTIRTAIAQELEANGLGPLPPKIMDNLATNAEKKMGDLIASCATREAILKAFRECGPKTKSKKPTTPAPENKK